MSPEPEKVIASFDSASVLHAGLVAALEGRPFSNLGNPEPLGRLIRVATRLPWPILRELYRRIGGSEGIPPEQLRRVDLSGVAGAFAEAFPDRQYPAALIGASNGALVHLAAAMQIPWLPQTVLIPVRRKADPHRPDEALKFGRQWGAQLLAANPDVALHQMHDAVQDELMIARMAYFRVKWQTLPEAYQRFLAERLRPGAPVFLAHDGLTWPATRVDDRHWFQTGGLGGVAPQDHLATPHAPQPDGPAPEAEWGVDPGFVAAIRDWCTAHDHPFVPINYHGPQQASATVAEILRSWLRARDERTDDLIIPSFILGDPWRTINRALVPYWTYFPVQEAVSALDAYLAAAHPYRKVFVLGFQHGARSPGAAGPEDFTTVITRHGAEPVLLGTRPQDWPHDIGSLARYGQALDRLPAGSRPWTPLHPDEVRRPLSTEELR
jgi:hypothetical protein